MVVINGQNSRSCSCKARSTTRETRQMYTAIFSSRSVLDLGHGPNARDMIEGVERVGELAIDEDAVTPYSLGFSCLQLANAGHPRFSSS